MEKIKILSGTFEPGCGITVSDGKDFFHVLCYVDNETGETYTEIKGKKYTVKDIIEK